MTLAEFGSLASLSRGVYAFVADVALFYLLESSQFDYQDAYLDGHLNREMEYDEEACVGCFLYVCASGHVHNNLAWEVKYGKKMIAHILVKKCVGVLPVKFKPGQMKTREEAAHVSSSVLCSWLTSGIWQVICQSPKMTLLKRMHYCIFWTWHPRSTVDHLRCNVCRSFAGARHNSTV